MNDIKFTLPLQLSQEDVVHLLKSGNDDFFPTLESVLDYANYSKKLSDSAFFILAKCGDSFIGCVAFYYNEEGRFIYISHFWVSRMFQKQHIGTTMLDILFCCVSGRYDSIMLEVNKGSSAISFYERTGFVIKEDRGNKFLLIKYFNS